MIKGIKKQVTDLKTTNQINLALDKFNFKEKQLQPNVYAAVFAKLKRTKENYRLFRQCLNKRKIDKFRANGLRYLQYSEYRARRKVKNHLNKETEI